MDRFLRVLGFIWLFPMTVVVWMIYVLPLWVLGQIKYDGSLDFCIAKFVLIEKNNWYSHLWRNFLGWSGPCIVIYRRTRNFSLRRTLKHEYRHCMQQFVFGPTHYPLYVLVFLYLWVFTAKHPYFDHPFEIDARKYEWGNNGQ